jgi:hypothetical protein
MLDFLKFRRLAHIPINDSNIKEMLDEISNHKSCIQILSKKLQEVISSITTFNNSVSVSLLDSLKSMFQSLKLAYSEITQLIHSNEEAVLKLNKHYEHLRKIYNSAEELEDNTKSPGNDGKLQAAHAVSYFDMKNLPEFEYKIEFSYSTEELVEDITEKLKSFSERCEQIQLGLSISAKFKERENMYKLHINQENLSFSTKHGFLDKSVESFYDLNHGHSDEVFKTVELHSDGRIMEISTDNPFRKYNSGVDDS